MKCNKCDQLVIDNNKDTEVFDKVKGIFPLTTVFVYMTMLLGYGLNGFMRIYSYLGLRKIRPEVYVRHADYVLKKALGKTKEILVECHQVVSKYYKEHFPDSVKGGLINIDVTYDGSWHKRGHTSH